uniref:GntR family transcriptional regulator n=1 Tax=uncultured Aeromicrobium sp. TaxID=337820 RepID=UPI0025E79221
MPAHVRSVSIIEAVTEDLRRRVLGGQLEPGTALAEADVAETYDVARPTAKMAIENLVRENLLQRSAHKTARVVRLSPDDARDIYLSREVVEAEVLRRLARKRLAPERARKANAEIAMLIDTSPGEVVEPDMRFHTALIDAIGSPRLSRTYGSLASEVVFCMSQVQGASLLPTELIAALIDRHSGPLEYRAPVPTAGTSGVGIVEGWRGTVVHRVEVDAGVVTRCKVVDPS